MYEINITEKMLKITVKSNFVLLDKNHNIIDVYLNGKKIDK